MNQRYVGIQKVINVLLLAGLLLTFATPAFADGDPALEKTDPLPVLPKPIYPIDGNFQKLQKAIELLRPYIEISSDGIPGLTIDARAATDLGVDLDAYLRIQANIREVTESIHQLPLERRPVVRDGQWTLPSSSGSMRTQPVCVTIPKWALQAFAWYVIAQGGAWAAIGGFLDGTILGLPAGAVLNALGIAESTTGFFLLWWVDNYYPAEGRRVCIF